MFVKAVIVLIVSCITIERTVAQDWTPDPFCPFPSDHVTRYPYYGNCSVYWECYEGTKYVMPCPDGLEFNAPLQQCDAPEIANCDPYASTTANPNPPTWTTISTTSHQPGPECPYPSEDLIYFPYPGDCTKYWECYEGNSYLYSCPEGLWWHEEISQCDYPGDFCNNSTQPTTEGTTGTTPNDTDTTSTDSTPVPITCPYPSDEITYYPYPGDCTKYFECYEGDLYVQACPEGLWWHEEIGQCDYPGDFCDNPGTTPSSTDTTSTDSTPVPITCPYPSDEITYYPYPGDCSKYFECYEGDLYVQACPEGLWWHEEIGQCDYPGDFCDESGTTPDSTDSTADTPNTDFTPDPSCPYPSDEITYYPYPGDCTRYLECFEGVQYIQECPDGLWWHEEISECDYPGEFCDNAY